jgi:hypothetical protein
MFVFKLNKNPIQRKIEGYFMINQLEELMQREVQLNSEEKQQLVELLNQVKQKHEEIEDLYNQLLFVSAVFEQFLNELEILEVFQAYYEKQFRNGEAH